jgi:hypothetical protein
VLGCENGAEQDRCWNRRERLQRSRACAWNTCIEAGEALEPARAIVPSSSVVVRDDCESMLGGSLLWVPISLQGLYWSYAGLTFKSELVR